MTKTLPKTHWKKLYNPNYIGAYSLEEGKDMVLTIKMVLVEPVTSSDGKAEDCTVIKWHEDAKPMILNKTNAKTISKLIGSPYIEDWPGNKVQLYVAKVKAFGDLVDALRVRPKKPTVNKPVLSPDHEKWTDAVNAVRKGNSTIEAIRKHYTLSDEHSQLIVDEAMA